MVRYNPSIEEGLNTLEISERIKNKLVNYDTVVPTKTIRQIITTNIFTLFNMLNFALAFSIILVGSYKNLLFMGVILSNIFIPPTLYLNLIINCIFYFCFINND